MTILCPFCNPDANRVFHEGRLVRGLWDLFPVTDGHALIVPKRHIATWFDASPAEQAEIFDTVAITRREIEARHATDGYNIGINIGEAAGQTVPHLHVHVIPRRKGDVANPRGGVRHVIPGRADYLAEPSPLNMTAVLTTGPGNQLLPRLEADLARATKVDIAVAFVLPSGVEKLFPHFLDLLQRGGRLRLLTGDYLDVTDPDALARLTDLYTLASRDKAKIRVYRTHGHSFHPKAYVISGDETSAVAYVGSSNLSSAALLDGIEWNYRVSEVRDHEGFLAVQTAFDTLWANPAIEDVTHSWLADYRSRRRAPSRPEGHSGEGIEQLPESELPPAPHRIQQKALDALRQTRDAGCSAGLVVMATGLGKTWLAAFDSLQKEFRRVLFVAHREEILTQALDRFRRVRPKDSMGFYTGDERTPDADVLFASIQTLSRIAHLERFDRRAFDYIVIDEFHHAAANTYRRLIDYFEPQFLLGLTATPERTDGGDLLALCQENLVYRCDVAEGIREGLLCPFSYYGVPDDVDYRNIPWRNRRFDGEALTTAVATQERARNIFEQWEKRGGTRTLAFCVSQQHADFMRDYFRARNITAASVHSGPSSDARSVSLEKLQIGELSILFAVDMFNEGVDVPNIDTVMMLRPTESQIVWLQQFGRGLRRVDDKRLRVIDYIGNHRSFLLKAQTLLQLPVGNDRQLSMALEKLQDRDWELPPGCEVTYELEAVDIMRGLLRPGRQDVLEGYYRDFRERHGRRPTAVEAFHDGYQPRSARPAHKSWLDFVASMDDLNDLERLALSESAPLLHSLDVTRMDKSFKMLVLLAGLNLDKLPDPGIAIDELVTECRRLAKRSGALRKDFGTALDSDTDLKRLIEKNPLAAWTGGRATGDEIVFAYEDGLFGLTLKIDANCRTEFQTLVRELVDWRLAEYLSRAPDDSPSAGFVLNVSHSDGRPILFLPDRATTPGIPEGWQTVLIDRDRYQANFVRIAINVVRKENSEENLLPKILRGWFGPDAGRPGTTHKVQCEPADGEFRISPLGTPAPDAPEFLRSYSREQIPRLFGEQFNPAVWNSGFVKIPTKDTKHICLLVTLEKSDLDASFQYGDRFLSNSEFQWQSQNKTKRESRDGGLIRNHADMGVDVHLFVRKNKKHGGASAPFTYCGPVAFQSWEGDKPITIRWRLTSPVPDRLYTTFTA